MPTVNLIGDSILWGYGLTAAQAPPAQLAALLAGTSATTSTFTPWNPYSYPSAGARMATAGAWSVYSACVPSATSYAERYSGAPNTMWQNNVQDRTVADYSFVHFGANDMANVFGAAPPSGNYAPGSGTAYDIEQNMAYFCQTERARGSVVFLCTMTPQYFTPAEKATWEGRRAGIAAYNTWVRDYCANGANGVHLCELYTTTADPSDPDRIKTAWDADTIHFSATGVSAGLAPLIKAAIDGLYVTATVTEGTAAAAGGTVGLNTTTSVAIGGGCATADGGTAYLTGSGRRARFSGMTTSSLKSQRLPIGV